MNSAPFTFAVTSTIILAHRSGLESMRGRVMMRVIDTLKIELAHSGLAKTENAASFIYGIFTCQYLNHETSTLFSD